MPKDPKRNIQNYQLRGGHLNEYEFQKSQSEMGEEAELPFDVQADNPNVSQAKRVAEVTAEAHQKVEKRKKRGVAKAQGRYSIAGGKKSVKRPARKPVKKAATRTATKKRASASGKRSAKKVAIKSTKKASTRTSTKKRIRVKK